MGLAGQTNRFHALGIFYIHTCIGEVHSPLDVKSKSHVMRSKFDSDPDSESENESQAKDVYLLPKRGYSGCHDTVTSEEEHSELSDMEQPEVERAEEKESE